MCESYVAEQCSSVYIIRFVTHISLKNVLLCLSLALRRPRYFFSWLFIRKSEFIAWFDWWALSHCDLIECETQRALNAHGKHSINIKCVFQLKMRDKMLNSDNNIQYSQCLVRLSHRTHITCTYVSVSADTPYTDKGTHMWNTETYIMYVVCSHI